MEQREIPARVVADVVGVTPDGIRSFRCNGFLEGVGERIGVGTYYSRTEALKIAIAVEIAKAGLGLKTAFEVVVANPMQEISAALAGHGGAVTFWPRSHPEIAGARQGPALACSVKIVVDAAALLRDAAARLDVALEKERHGARSRRRLSFGPAPTMGQPRA